MEVAAELLGQSDEDAFRATHEADPVAVLVLRDLANEFGTVGAQAGNDVVDVVDRSRPYLREGVVRLNYLGSRAEALQAVGLSE